MTNNERPVDKFEKFVAKAIDKQLAEIEDRIHRLENAESVDEIATLLEEANSVINLACGEDDDLYQDWKYRLFMTETGRAVVIQGREIDVDFKLWMDQDNLEK